MTPLFEAIVKHIPPPVVASEPFFQMLVSNLHYSDYLGRIALGRIVSGRVAVGDSIVCMHRDGRRERANVTALFTYAGLEQVETQHASAGDIVGLTGFEDVYIGETLTDREERAPLQFVDIDPPTIRMRILVNDSPFAGREGKFVTARHVRERLIRKRAAMFLCRSTTPSRPGLSKSTPAAKCRLRSSSNKCDAKATK